MTKSTTTPSQQRIVSLDQFRGYTVSGMFLVNFVGSYIACPLILKHHHTFCSYADTIMPHFLFAVGFAFRLTFERRFRTSGQTAVYARMVRRLLGLMLVSIVIYTAGKRAETWEQLVDMGFWDILAEPLKRNWFQTLAQIAVTSLWILPVIRAGAKVRIAFMIASAGLHVWLSYLFNFTWVNTGPNGIDGGPLGFLTWTIPALVGTLACDAVVGADGRLRLGRPVFWAIVLMGLGWGISCGTRFYDVPAEDVARLRYQKLATHPVIPDSDQIANRPWSTLLAEPPFIPPPTVESRKWNYWMMSQRAGTLSYLTFCAGLSLLVYVLFYLCCDVWGWQIGFFRTLGTNALIAYVIHLLVGRAVRPFIPKDAPAWYLWTGFVVFFWIVYLFVRHLEKNKIYLRL